MADLIYLLGLSMLAIMVAYFGSLSHKIKQLFFISDFQVKKYEKLQAFKSWIDSGLWYLCPIALLFKLQSFLNGLFNCAYCQATWYGFAYGLSVKETILQSICYAGLCIIGVLIIEKTLMK